MKKPNGEFKMQLRSDEMSKQTDKLPSLEGASSLGKRKKTEKGKEKEEDTCSTSSTKSPRHTTRAANKKIIKEFLERNTQFNKGELQFNHESLALWLKQFKHNYHKEQVFIAGGAADLFALLSRLRLDTLGDEAFILIRPYIHTMVIYLRREKDGICCFLFDSQRWGMRYYPNRLIIEALIKYFPSNARIYLSGTEVQSQQIQRGCTEYSLTFLKYVAEYGNELFKFSRAHAIELKHHIDPKHVNKLINHYPWLLEDRIFMLRNHALPEKLLDQFQQALKTQAKYFKELSVLLKTEYTNEGELDWDKIYTTLDEVHGCLLTPSSYELTLYPFEIDLDKNVLIIQLPHGDHLYNNFLLYSNDLYPAFVSLNSISYLWSNELQVNYNSNIHILTFSLVDITRLPDILNKVPTNNYFSAHMRQRLALQVMKQQIIERLNDEIELQKIQVDARGGLDTRQAQLALRQLFSKYESTVYVPDFKMLGDEINLDELKNYLFIIFTLPINTEHQVAIWITSINDAYHVEIYDSLIDESNIRKAEELLRIKLHSMQPILFKEIMLPKLKQKNDWECGVYSIYALCKLANVRLPNADFMDFDNDTLNLSFLTRQYYFAFKLQEKLEEKNEIEELKNSQAKKALIEILSTQTNNIAIINQLIEFIKANHAYSPHELSAKYTGLYPGEEVGCYILSIASLYCDDSECLKDIITQILPYILFEVNAVLLNQMDLLCGYPLNTYLSEVNNIRQKFNLIKDIFNVYLINKESNPIEIINAILGGKLEFFDKESQKGFIEEINKIDENPAMQLVLLTRVIIKYFIKITSHLESEDSRLTVLNNEENLKLYQIIDEERGELIKKILGQAGLANVPKVTCIQLAKNNYAWHYIYNYVRSTDYFDGVEEERALELLNEILQLNCMQNTCAAAKKYLSLHNSKTFINFVMMIRPGINQIDVKRLLKQVPDHERAFLVKELASYVAYILDILHIIPIHQRVEVVNYFSPMEKVVESSRDLSYLITLLPEQDQLPFAIKFHQVCMDSREIAEIIKKLPPNAMLSFALVQIDNIFRSANSKTDFTVLLHFLHKRNPEICHQFIAACKHKITSYNQLALILHYLPPGLERLSFCLRIAQTIINNQSDQADYVEKGDISIACDPLKEFLLTENMISYAPASYRINISPLDVIIYYLGDYQQIFISKLSFKDFEQLLGIFKITQNVSLLNTIIIENIKLIFDKDSLNIFLQKLPRSSHDELIAAFHANKAEREQIRKAKKEQEGAELIDIRKLRIYFDCGYLKITPKNIELLLTEAKNHADLFQSYEGGILIKNWSPTDNSKLLLKLLFYFANVKKVRFQKCLVNDLPQIIRRPMQFYKQLEILNIKSCSLADDAIKSILHSISSQKKLIVKIHDFENDELLAKIHIKYPNIKILPCTDKVKLGNKKLYLAAKSGDRECQYHLGLAYFQSEWNQEKKWRKVKKWYERAGEQGSGEAYDRLGVIYLKGLGLWKECYEDAFKCFEIAANKGIPTSINHLGVMYFKGEGVERNIKKAFECFQKGAEHNNREAQYNLGIMYKEGCGVERDLKKAKALFKKALEQGHLQAGMQLNAIGR